MADRQQGSAERGWKAFLEHEGVALHTRRKRSSRPGRSLPHALVAALGTAALITPLAVAQGDDGGADAAARGDVLRQEVRNGTTRSETEIIGQFNATTGGKGGYVTRQSNTQTGARAGGGAIYGCRGAAGGTAVGSAPCLRASNLANGFAFEFASNAGPTGLFDVATATDAPFVTDGRGLVANLNADLLDGRTAGDFLAASGKAADADKLDGKNSSEFLGATAKAADADTLDGKNSSEFLTKTEAMPFRVRLSFGDKVEFASNGPVGLEAQCRANISGTQDEVRILAVTREDGAFMQGDTPHSGPGVSSNHLNVDTPEDSRTMGGLVSTPAGDGLPAADDDIDTGFVMSSGGRYIGIDETTAYTLNVGGSNCQVVGIATIIR